MHDNNQDQELNQEDLKENSENTNSSYIIKIPHKKNFTIFDNKTLYDTRLSAKSTCYLTIMVSFPDDWKIKVSHLAKLKTDGITAVRSAIKELIQFGYMDFFRPRDSKGRLMPTVYIVSEIPKTKEEMKQFKKSLPHSGFHDMDIPCMDSVQLLSTNSTNTHINKKESKPKKETVAKAPLASDDAHIYSKYLFKKLQEIRTDRKQPNWKQWDRDFDLMIRKDKIKKEDILKAIDFVFREDNTFKVESAASLRSKYENIADHMVIQRKPIKATIKNVENKELMLKIYDVYLNKYRKRCIGFIQEKCLELKNDYFIDPKRGDKWKTHATLENLIYQLKNSGYVSHDSFQTCLSIELKEALTIWKCDSMGAAEIFKNYKSF